MQSEKRGKVRLTSTLWGWGWSSLCPQKKSYIVPKDVSTLPDFLLDWGGGVRCNERDDNQSSQKVIPMDQQTPVKFSEVLPGRYRERKINDIGMVKNTPSQVIFQRPRLNIKRGVV